MSEPSHNRLAAVIVNWRTPAATVAAARSLAASARRVDQLIVVDNASGDGSERELRVALPDATHLAAPENLGFAGGANLGIRRALEGGAQSVFLLNSDAAVREDCLEKLERALASDRSVGIVAPLVLEDRDPGAVDSAGISFDRLTGRVRLISHGERVTRANVPERRAVDGVAGCAMLVSREVFERVGLFDEGYFFTFEDLDLCLRARAAGLSTLCVGEAIATHRGGATLSEGSATRAYFATRNHLKLARSRAPLPLPLSALRATSIASLNALHALVRTRLGAREGLWSVAKGVWHHARGRYGAPPA